MFLYVGCESGRPRIACRKSNLTLTDRKIDRQTDTHTDSSDIGRCATFRQCDLAPDGLSSESPSYHDRSISRNGWGSRPGVVEGLSNFSRISLRKLEIHGE